MKKLRLTGDVGYYNGNTGEGITSAIVQKLLDDANGEDLEIELSTFGGNFFEGVAIMEMLKGYKGKKFGTGLSIVASAGTVISLAFDTFKVRPTTMFMIHNAQGWSMGDHNQMREDADLYERMSNLIADEYAKKTGKKRDAIKKMMDDETWLMGKEIVDEGFADELEDAAEQPTSMALVMAQKQFRDRVSMWTKQNTEGKPDAVSMAQVESLIDAGMVDKLDPIPSGAELSVKEYPIAKQGKVYRSSLRSISHRAAKDDPELAKWATAMIAKIDAGKEKRVNKEAVLAWLKDNPGVPIAELAAALGQVNMIVTPEVAKAVELKAKLDAENIADPLATIATLKADLEKVETDKVTNIMDATFGPVKLSTGVENSLRTYAGVKLAGVKSADLAAKIEEFKKDTLALKLAGELMDANADVNLIFGAAEKNVKNKAPTTFQGVPMATV